MPQQALRYERLTLSNPLGREVAAVALGVIQLMLLMRRCVCYRNMLRFSFLHGAVMLLGILQYNLQKCDAVGSS